MRMLLLGLLIACSDKGGTPGADSGTVPDPTVDVDGDGVVAADDCDDQNALAYPGAAEVCGDPADLNCDGLPGDYDADADGFPACEDCADDDGSTNPGAAERCDGLDNNCDTQVDEGAYDAWIDADGDGFGAGSPVETCGELPAGYASADGDCDEASATVYPGAPESCDDPIDTNCDGSAGNVDNDADGFRSCEECDDNDVAVNPGATEVCNGGVDDNCDGTADGADAVGAVVWYRDADGDTWGTSETVVACDMPAGYADHDGDCDDTNSTSFPDGVETTDSSDNDCDGWVDEDAVVFSDIVISEVMRQPRFGETSTQSDGMWFEVYNASSRDIYLDNWYVVRDAPIDGVTVTDWFQIDPLADLLVPAGGYAVLCKSDNYEASAGVAYPLACDYVWGNEAEASGATGLYWDNTFNLQRDEDYVYLVVGTVGITETPVDGVHWYYDDTNGYWPRDARFSMSLDPSTLNAGSNDASSAWCSTSAAANDTSWSWYDTPDSDDDEHGTPGFPNQACP